METSWVEKASVLRKLDTRFPIMFLRANRSSVFQIEKIEGRDSLRNFSSKNASLEVRLPSPFVLLSLGLVCLFKGFVSR